MKKTVVICAGQPGSGRDEYLEELKNKRDFFYYHLFEYLVEEAQKQGYALNKLNVLDFYDSKPMQLENFRAAALERIIREIGNKDGVHVISTPYHFEWKGKSYNGLEDREVKTLSPDLFLVVVDDLVRVRERLKDDPQWREHSFTLIELSQWRREEISGIYNLSRGFTPYKEFYIAAKEHGVELLEDLIFNRHKKKVYLSHPITGEGAGFFQKVREFVASLQPYYTVFDPSMIKDWELVETWRTVRNKATAEGKDLPKKIDVTIRYSDKTRRYEVDSWDVEAAINSLRAQVIDIDYKIIESSSYVIAYHPREQLSAGVLCEMVQAKGLAKFVYVFYPFEPSPFFEWYATKMFPKEDEIVSSLKEMARKETNFGQAQT